MIRIWQKLLIALFLIFPFGLFNAGVFAQSASNQQNDSAAQTELSTDNDEEPLADEEPSADEELVTDQEPATPAPEPEPEPEQPEINPDATFTPTEEISEDKPVAFPVDI